MLNCLDKQQISCDEPGTGGGDEAQQCLGKFVASTPACQECDEEVRICDKDRLCKKLLAYRKGCDIKPSNMSAKICLRPYAQTRAFVRRRVCKNASHDFDEALGFLSRCAFLKVVGQFLNEGNGAVADLLARIDAGQVLGDTEPRS